MKCAYVFIYAYMYFSFYVSSNISVRYKYFLFCLRPFVFGCFLFYHDFQVFLFHVYELLFMFTIATTEIPRLLLWLHSLFWRNGNFGTIY